jgi:hypothetical protein
VELAGADERGEVVLEEVTGVEDETGEVGV